MGTPKTPPETLQLGPFQLLVAHRVLLREGQAVGLAPRAVEVLVVLASRANEIVSKDELMRAVWPDTFVEEVNLAVHVSALRKLLASAGGVIQIETIPKRGYRLRGDVRPLTAESPGIAVGVVDEPVAAGVEGGAGPSEPSRPAEPTSDQSTGPDSTVGRPSEEHPQLGHRLRARTLAGLAVAVVLLIASGVWLDRWATHTHKGVEAGGARIQSLAVLPLDNLSGDPKQDYFAAGITDELTTELAHIHGLRVVSRTSASQFQGGHRSLPEIAHALGVEGVIEGSVVRAGNKVRITTQLIEASSDRHLWAGTYEDSIEEVIALQDRVARDVAREVRAAVKPESALPAMSARGRQPVDRKAYDDYLQGLYVWNRRDPRTYEKAIEYFSRATAEDPRFAPAFASLADLYVLWGLNGEPREKSAPKARQAALEALAQDGNSAEAHAALAAISAVFEWDWTTAAKEFQLAIDLDPNYATGHQWYADFYLVPERRLDEAGKELQTALALDPLSPIMIVDDGWVRYLRGDYPQAKQEFERAIAMDPDFVPAHFRMEGWYQAQGRNAEFAQYLARNARMMLEDEVHAQAIDQAFARDGIRGVARAQLEYGRRKDGFQTGLVTAQYYAILEDADGACSSLQKGLRERHTALLYLNVDPRYASLRAFPCYSQVVQQMGLPQPPQ